MVYIQFNPDGIQKAYPFTMHVFKYFKKQEKIPEESDHYRKSRKQTLMAIPASLSVNSTPVTDTPVTTPVSTPTIEEQSYQQQV